MSKEEISGNVLDLNILKRLFKFVKPYQGYFYFLVFLTVALALLVPARPYLIQVTIDQYVGIKDYNGLVSMILLLVGLLILQAVVQYLHTYFSGWLGQHIIRDIRIKLFKHIQSL
ncbi:MAG: ABC transporter transmembrane domain-containing protein, partial [Bacteroidota bacterium]